MATEAEASADLLTRPLSELAELVRGGQVTSRELVEASLERIEALDPQVNAFTTLDAERALATADAVGAGDDRPFAGVPIAIKDLGATVAGIRQAMGTELSGDWTPGYDSFAVRRIKEAGFVIVGVTSTPEVGILPVTEPRRFGPTRNPWDLERTPGGSSGGAAAAVAAGMVPAAHGSDGGGSIRIPAACCGLVGLKASRGRISRGPDLGDHVLTTDGVLTRTVAETAAMLDVLAGYEPGDATWAPPPTEPFAERARREPGRLRVAMTVEPPIDAEVDPACARAVTEAGDLLVSLGHEVEEATPPWADQSMLQVFSAVFGASVSVAVAYAAMVGGREPSEESVEALTWHMFSRCLELNSVGYLFALAQLQRYARELIAWMSSYDVLLTPALAERPVPIGEIDSTADDPEATFARSGRFTPFTAAFNATGQPAISLPLFQGDDGLPMGVQLVGQPAGEGALLALAAQLERARPWADRRAPTGG
ncbi:MAG: amidase [Thermoleophilaceae bacterium]|nr:amidase [Thermoleophilaceae bacterium]